MNCADGPHHVGLVVLVITAHKALWFARCAMSYPAGTGPGKLKVSGFLRHHRMICLIHQLALVHRANRLPLLPA